jgi:hypothetical protein
MQCGDIWTQSGRVEVVRPFNCLTPKCPLSFRSTTVVLLLNIRQSLFSADSPLKLKTILSRVEYALVAPKDGCRREYDNEQR